MGDECSSGQQEKRVPPRVSSGSVLSFSGFTGDLVRRTLLAGSQCVRGIVEVWKAITKQMTRNEDYLTFILQRKLVFELDGKSHKAPTSVLWRKKLRGKPWSVSAI